MTNIIKLTDSYKFTHWPQYPPKTTKVFSYLESRGGAFPKTVFFGLQYQLKKYLEGKVVTREKIDEAAKRINTHMGCGVFNRLGWEYILNKHNGHLPIKIQAVEEGSFVDTGNVLVTMQNTDPNCYWLTNYLETLLVQLWYPITVATQSQYMKQDIMYYLNLTGADDQADFKLHDFGFRGSTSVESAGIGGAAHLVNFKGTDTFAGIDLLMDYYYSEMPGHSIPASEHSTITSWGEENEVEAMRNMLDKYPTGLVACVSDSYDIYRACEKYWGEELRDKIINRDGVLIVRPDSGVPYEVVIKVLDILWSKFGGTVNSKGYKTLDPHVRVIQGDGIDRKMMNHIMSYMEINKYSIDNIAFGSGGGLLQKMDRDTCKFAFKCSAIQIDENWWKDVYKSPVTDSGKQSKRGRLYLYKDDKGYLTTDVRGPDNLLTTVFENGKIVRRTTLDKIRERLKNETASS